MSEIRGPSDTDRTIVIGRTGSGKSQWAMALLSTRDWDRRPWFFLDFKGEDLMEDILDTVGDAIPQISINSQPPKKPGLYYVKVRPMVDDAAIELFLQRIYDRASNGSKRFGSGIFIDEGLALNRNSKFFDIILTQGRTLKCPVIALYQKPNYMSRFAVTQSTFRALFDLEDERERITAANFFRPFINSKGEKITAFSLLPKFHCLYYDVSSGSSTVLAPAPSREAIIHRFKARLSRGKNRALI